MTTARLLIVDDEKIAVKNLEYVMRKEGWEVVGATSGSAALDLLERQSFDVLLTDLRMEKVDGFRLLHTCRERYPDIEVIILTGFATLETAVEAMKQGAFYYIAKPFRLDEVRKVTAEALEKVRLKRENRQLREVIARYQGERRIITQDPAMLKLIELARRIAPTGCNVLISGESGVGKELFARFLHEAGNHPAGPFVAINCGAFNEELLENELFGHAKGAFTGASSPRKGLIEAAHGGTLFLDEFTEMSAAMQVNMLRVLQEREVRPLGENAPVSVDVRFIGATNRNLTEEVRQGRFRQDLFYRLNVANLAIPPLARRKGDIPLLCHYFLRQFAEQFHKEVEAFDPAAMALLTGYDYPGNVRELRNVIERAVAMGSGPVLRGEQLPEELRQLSIRILRRPEGRLPTLEEREKEYILWVFHHEARGNQTLAAQMLGIDRVSLWRKLKRFQGEEEENG
ncbi:MAG: sigma-54-dependent Fis family transcriptional regulator [Magnetococcales bacterium]|nr:sigma-54-dependent Fis family transcriptional regulator [Magnetococcales bacterium]